MADVLFYWRDYKPKCMEQSTGPSTYFWHSSLRHAAKLQAGDRLWFVTSGKNIGHVIERAGFLVANWQVREVVSNPDDDPAYPAVEYRFRIVGDPSASVFFEDGILIDDVLRPAEKEISIPIGKILQKGRVLPRGTIRALKDKCGAQMALTYLRGRD